MARGLNKAPELPHRHLVLAQPEGAGDAHAVHWGFVAQLGKALRLQLGIVAPDAQAVPHCPSRNCPPGCARTSAPRVAATRWPFRPAGAVEAGALQQQATVGRHELEVELAVLSRYCLKAGRAVLAACGLELALFWGQAAQATAARSSRRKGWLSRGRAGRRPAAWLRCGQGPDQRLVAFAQGRTCRPHARTTAVWHRPGNACGVGPAQGPVCSGGGKSPVDLEQGRAFGVPGSPARESVTMPG